ncbi:hypothetical protein [Mesorhizobium sp. SP-1A]|uniref:hypothetical protein n=1 Tax=Mesorhizobium sp. SP-1A TaxID=3077840 RepID=UPI0028F6E147|nr:hypothetical protein [Mesorhizobium sp. SP-1A]
MMIKVPFKYEARVHKKRFKEPSNETFYEWLDVEIPEIDDIDAPIATQWFDETPDELRSLNERENWGAAPQDGICQTRWFNNDHWWPALDVETKSQDYKKFYRERMTPERLTELCKDADEKCNPLMLKDTFTRQMHTDIEYKGNALDPKDFKAVYDSNREEVFENLQDRLTDLMIVDGQIWVRGKPPVVYLKTHILANDETGNLVGLLKILPEGDSSIKNANQVYSLNQFNDAREVAMSFASEDQADPNERIKLTVLVAESIKDDAEQKAIVQIAHEVDEKFSDHFSKDYRKMNELPPETGISYFEFRRALLALDGSDERIENLVEAMQKFQPLCEIAHEDSGRRMRHILGRWETKPIELNFDNH